jgi:hypothetical protein
MENAVAPASNYLRADRMTVPAPGATVAAAFTDNVVRLGASDKFDPDDAQSDKVPTISSDVGLWRVFGLIAISNSAGWRCNNSAPPSLSAPANEIAGRRAWMTPGCSSSSWGCSRS